MISKWSKFAQKEYKSRHYWVGKVIHWKLYNMFKIDYMNMWFMHNLEYILENKKHKLLWDYEIQTDHLISAKWLYVVIDKKKRTSQ